MSDNVVKRVSTIFSIKDDGFSKSLSDINKQMKLTQTEIGLAGQKLKTYGSNTDDLKYKQEALSQQIANVKDKMALYTKSIQDNSDKLTKNRIDLNELGKKKDDLNAKYKEAIKLYGNESKEAAKLKTELDKTKEAYKEKENLIKSNTNAINNHTTDLKKNETELVKLQGELKKTNTELTTSQSKWVKAGDALKASGEDIKAFGSKVSSAGNTLTIGVSLPILAVGTAATKMAMDAVESENLFEVSMGSMADAARKWTDETAKALGLNAFELRKSVGTFNVMLTAMGQTDKEALNMSETLSKLAYDMASFYNLDPSVAFDKLRAGISGETEPLKQLGIVVSEAAVQQYALEKGLIRQIPVLDSHGKAVKDAFGKIKMQTQELDDATKVQARYGLIMELTAKAQGDLSRTMDSPTNKLRIQTEQIKQQAIELGIKLIPYLERGLVITGKIVDWLDSLNDEQKDLIIKIGLITAAAGPLLSIGGKFISIGGSLVGAVGKISTALGTAEVATSAAGTVAGAAGGASGFGALAGGLGTAALAAAPYVLAAAAVAGAGYLVYKGLTEETVPAVDLFADKVEYASKTVDEAGGYMSSSYQTSVTKISKSTQDAVSAYLTLDKEASKYLLSVRVNSEKISKETADSMIKIYSDMGTQITAKMKQNQDEQYKTLQNFFANTSALTSTEEAETLKKLQDNYLFEKQIVDYGINEINAILTKASNEKRELTEQEARTINNIQENMKKQAIQTLSENEVEAQIILQRMKDYDGRITAEQAAEHIKKLNESRDNAVKSANDEYEKRIATITRMRDESKIISSDQADKLIAEAKRQRDGIIEKAEDTRLNALDKMRQLNKDLDDEVDTGTGDILTWWDKLARWWNGWKPEKKTFSYSTNYSDPWENTQSRATAGRNALGTNYFQGGLTYYNEQGYELIDLPVGSKIRNHASSEVIVRRTAEEVANQMLSGIASILGTEKDVYLLMDSQVVGKAVVPIVSRELASNAIRKRS